MTVLISVIIPIHNVENCLDECFSSVLAQETQFLKDGQRLEVSVYDDGSKDTSPQVNLN